MRPAGPPEGSNAAPAGGSAAAKPQAWGHSLRLPIAAMLAAFAIGATALQYCARLPPVPGECLIVAVILGAATVALRARLVRLPRAQEGDDAPPLRSCIVERISVRALAITACGIGGFFYGAWRADVRLADALPPAWEERDIRVVGVVDDLPQNGPVGTHFAFAIERIETAGATVPQHVSLGWFARPPADGPNIVTPAVHAGERWALTVRLKRPHGNINPDGFDLEAWLLERNLRATGYVRDASTNRRLDPFAGRFGDHVQRARERVRARIANALPDAPYAGVVTALAIGDQRAIPEAQWSIFNRTGITHLVSISGLHVTVFAMLAGGCAFLALRRATTLTSRVPARKLAAVVGAAFAFGYVLLAGAEVPAVRTLCMLLVAAAGLWLGRPGTATVVWLWSLVAVLLCDPWASLSPGFWLSFGAVGLLLYAGSGRLFMAASPGIASRAGESLRDAARAQWVVTVGLVPGTLALFQQVSVVSALANAVAIPVVTLAVVPLALTAIAIPLDAPWQAAHAVLALLMRYLEWLSAWPTAAWASHSPRGWTVGVAIAGVLWLVAPRGVPGRLAGVIWMLPMALVIPPPVPWGSVRLTVLDVGQGLAVVIATHGHAMVYDTGPRYTDTADAGGRVIAPFLRAAGVGRLDALIISHADTDHSGGALSILRAVPVERLIASLPGEHPIMSAIRPSQGANSASWGAERRLMPQAPEEPADIPRGKRPTLCEAGLRWEWDGIAFAILHPRGSDRGNPARKSNDLSCVLHIASSSGSVLLTGDIEALSEGELLERDAPRLRADVIVVPHHGSRTSSTEPFIAAVAPRIAIVAAGYRNRFHHPRAEILARYQRAGADRFRTDREGAITVTLGGERGFDVQRERERRRRYWYDAMGP